MHIKLEITDHSQIKKSNIATIKHTQLKFLMLKRALLASPTKYTLTTLTANECVHLNRPLNK